MAGPDAVVIIRGGGAIANDLAWLNDYALARALCELPVPVLTGIGHERDSTILDEVANMKFDTPSKVAAGIKQVIKKRVQEAKDNFELLTSTAHRALNMAHGQLENVFVTVPRGRCSASRPGQAGNIGTGRKYSFGGFPDDSRCLKPVAQFDDRGQA